MKTSEIDDVKTNIGKLQEFPAGADAKTLAGWAAYVQEKWDNLADTTKTELNDVITSKFFFLKFRVYRGLSLLQIP